MDSIIRVIVVDDDDFWLAQLTRTLAKDERLEVVAAASDRKDAISLTLDLKPDILVLDINLSENRLDGLDVARHLLGRIPVKIVMLSSIMEDEVILEAFDCGAVNYLTKESFHDIQGAIIDAYDNRSHIHADVAEVLRRGLRSSRREVRLGLLSPSERELYELEEKGFTKSEMAAMLHKSMNTIKGQFKSLRKKIKGSRNITP